MRQLDKSASGFISYLISNISAIYCFIKFQIRKFAPSNNLAMSCSWNSVSSHFLGLGRAGVKHHVHISSQIMSLATKQKLYFTRWKLLARENRKRKNGWWQNFRLVSFHPPNSPTSHLSFSGFWPKIALYAIIVRVWGQVHHDPSLLPGLLVRTKVIFFGVILVDLLILGNGCIEMVVGE